VRFAVAVGIGRAFRFLLEGFIAVRYGERAKEVLARNYPAVGLGVAVLIVAVFVIRNLLKRRRGKIGAGGRGPGAGEEHRAGGKSLSEEG
jgi:hypothetical protein